MIIMVILSEGDASFDIFSMASYTSFSLFSSKALVASSKISIFGFLISALAIAILYFYPPLKFIMLVDPTKVSNLFSNVNTK